LNLENNGLGIVVLSGPIGAGKSELAERLVAHYDAKALNRSGFAGGHFV
jgi:deoxyadenosine/deoxycytidine kinase